MLDTTPPRNMLSRKAAEPVAIGAACPACGRFALVEPGGVRCLEGGHLALFRRVIPKATTGHDRANRIRQEAVDRAFISPGRGALIPIEMLERLEGRENRAAETGVSTD